MALSLAPMVLLCMKKACKKKKQAREDPQRTGGSAHKLTKTPQTPADNGRDAVAAGISDLQTHSSPSVDSPARTRCAWKTMGKPAANPAALKVMFILTQNMKCFPVDGEVTETDLSEELPLCCCHMETPCSRESLFQAEHTCMATERVYGLVSLTCSERNVVKPEMMRPSNTVHLLVLCEDHRPSTSDALPACGLFCRAGTFMEYRPYGSISQHFHSGCASVIKAQSFCPHCGEDATGAQEVTVPKPVTAPKREPVLPLVPAVSPVAPVPAVSTRFLFLVFSMRQKKVKYHTKQLSITAHHGELQKVIHLLVDGKDLNTLMDRQNKRTPLHAAAAEGHQEVCHMLVQAGANLDIVDEEQRTPLMDACDNNHLDTVKYPLRAGTAVSYKVSVWTTLGHYTIVDHLLSKTSEQVNCQDDGGCTHITWAIEYKHRELVLLLLSKGADVNIRDKEENIGLHWAALSGSDDITQILLDARCDLHAVNVHGDSPLHIAARENQLECVTLLLSRGTDVNLRNRGGETPLDCCIYNSKVWAALNTNKKLTDARRSILRKLANEMSIFLLYSFSPKLKYPFLYALDQLWLHCMSFELVGLDLCILLSVFRARLQLYKTQRMGWGVRALQDIPQGTFISEENGFLFTLDNEVGDVHCIDARLFGNIGRFINHLCEPNLLAVRVFTVQQDLRFPRIAFFSASPFIPPLRFDYGDHFWKVKSKYYSCQCCSPTCRHSSAAIAQGAQSLERVASPSPAQQSSSHFAKTQS
uniref:Euchromatic histone-lysine N-methyltransferase 1a n=1 Tax=Oncorhynchus tshawytscha TaxID=74940 RepID=A0AAZ3QYC4_ONCTS